MPSPHGCFEAVGEFLMFLGDLVLIVDGCCGGGDCSKTVANMPASDCNAQPFITIIDVQHTIPRNRLREGSSPLGAMRDARASLLFFRDLRPIESPLYH